MTYHRILVRLCVPVIALAGAACWLQAGCTFDAGGITGNPVDANPNADAAPTPDVPPNDPCLDWTPVPAHFNPCAIQKPEDPNKSLILTVPGTYTYDTNSGILRDPQSNEIVHTRQVLTDPEPDIRLVSVDSFELGPDSTLRATGSIPLLIASWSTIEVTGTIDVSSSLQNGQGAGANTGTCNEPSAGSQSNDGGGGGGGGGFGDDGGDGGDGGGGNGTKGNKGIKLGGPSTNVRGGCAGEKGAAGDQNDGSGAGGPGGGAVQITARNSISISGRLHAGGAGGGGANGSNSSRRSGGGGGGSGGMLSLEAPAITISDTAILAANGGGGGGGCNGSQADNGGDGLLGNIAASGGVKEGDGGDGGDGGFVTTTPGQPGVNGNRGGGGGGGGVGYIILSTTPTITGTPVFSPIYVTP